MHLATGRMDDNFQSARFFEYGMALPRAVAPHLLAGAVEGMPKSMEVLSHEVRDSTLIHIFNHNSFSPWCSSLASVRHSTL